MIVFGRKFNRLVYLRLLVFHKKLALLGYVLRLEARGTILKGRASKVNLNLNPCVWPNDSWPLCWLYSSAALPIALAPEPCRLSIRLYVPLPARGGLSPVMVLLTPDQT